MPNPFAEELARRQGGSNPFAAELARRDAVSRPVEAPAAGDQAQAGAAGRLAAGFDWLASLPGAAVSALRREAADPERGERGELLAALRAAEEGRPGAVMPTREQMAPIQERTLDATIEGAIASVAPSLGARIGRVLQSPLRYAGRGARTIPEAARAGAALRAEQAATGIVDTRGAATKIMTELAKSAGIPAAAGMASTPLLGPLGPMTGAGGAVVQTLLRLRPATAELLANHPGFARWALSSGANPTGLGAKLGALTGIAATAGPDVADAIKAFKRELEGAPGPQAGASDFTGPLPTLEDRLRRGLDEREERRTVRV